MRLLKIAGLALLLAGAVSACSDREPAGHGGDEPISATPAPPSVSDRSLLHEARLDAASARRLNVDPLKVELVSLRHAGWDGCLGVASPGTPCREIFVAGYIAVFRAGDREVRYHIGLGRFIGPVDPAKATVSDGSPVPPEMQTDFNAVLALYARYDFTLRTKQSISSNVTQAILPVAFPDACLGWERPGAMCALVVTPGAIVLLRTPGDKTYRYHVSATGIIATDFTPGAASVEPTAALLGLQRRLREDVAARTGVAIEKVSLYSFREVTWPNGCLGVELPGAVCTQALVDGFLATLSDGTGAEYRYHGAGDHFIAASFEQGARLADPLPREP